jgi:hypothetical protein
MTGNPQLAFGRLRLAAGTGLLLALVLLAGCGPGKGEVSGKVTYKGAPLPGGLLTFRHADSRHNSVAVELAEDGSFKVVLPAGEVTASVDNTGLAPVPELAPPSLTVPLSPEAKKALGSTAQPKASGGATKRSNRYVEIPARYQDAETSGLTFTVKGGSQTQDFALTE